MIREVHKTILALDPAPTGLTPDEREQPHIVVNVNSRSPGGLLSIGEPGDHLPKMSVNVECDDDTGWLTWVVRDGSHIVAYGYVWSGHRKHDPWNAAFQTAKIILEGFILGPWPMNLEWQR